MTLTGHGRVLADIVAHFVKANGLTSQKVFRGGTRRAWPGNPAPDHQFPPAQHPPALPRRNRIEALINGRRQELGVIDVVAATTD